jgi:hypothetical protein
MAKDAQCGHDLSVAEIISIVHWQKEGTAMKIITVDIDLATGDATVETKGIPTKGRRKIQEAFETAMRTSESKKAEKLSR